MLGSLLAADGGWCSAKAQMILLGFIFIGVTSVYHALHSMAGGIGNRDIVAEAGMWVHGMMIGVSILAPVSVNVLGVRANLFFGAMGYLLYNSSLFFAGKLHWVDEHWIVVGGASLGAGAACFWTAQGVVVSAYPTKETKGNYFALFWTIQNIGTMLACFLTFVLNYQTKADSASSATFVVFIILNLIGTFVCWMMVSEQRVVRPDGSQVQVLERPNACREFMCVLSRFLDVRYLALIPLFLACKYPFTYQFYCFNKALFTIRTQGLNDVFYYLSQALGSIAIGRFVDRPGMSPRKKGWWTLLILGGFSVSAWVLGLVANAEYELDNPIALEDQIDFQDSRWILPMLLYVSWGLSDTCIQSFTYWLLGQLEDRPEELSRSYGFMQAVQQVGGLIGLFHFNGKLFWQSGKAPASHQCLVNLALVVLMIPGTALMLWYIARARKDGKTSDATLADQ